MNSLTIDKLFAEKKKYEDLRKCIDNGMFKEYSLDELFIDNKYLDLTEIEKKLRRSLMNYTLQYKKPFNIKAPSIEVIKDIGLNIEKLNEIINRFVEKNIVVVNDKGDINFIYPVSALPTHHLVTLSDKRKFNAMCAIDSLGSTFTFGQDIEILSECSECGEKIKIEIKNGKIKRVSSKNIRVLHVDLNKHKNWSGSC